MPASENLQGAVFKYGLAPISINGTAATCTEVDTVQNGYKFTFCTVIFGAGVIGAAAFDEVSIGHSDTSGSGHTAITGLTWTDPSATDDGKLWTCHFSLLGKKRYLLPVIDPGAVDCLATMIFILQGGGRAASSDSERGTAQSLITG
jgi:hypothetical protein